ncbi:hypothetical protein CROQUDRAFT_651177 [Cronartium quercuum f. sp. fusiforme G11]|uniref:Uncharacterized protein n=1 Tax=Cronartium quercuum f. sp. fusiforme G11 TaxID=708437 RepID=A0A9P6NWA2_9BASI|nr:hypothetical protein CROQUDRAFT_651177 [Cronartium quercuum f. sp. fusiforme G11]
MLLLNLVINLMHVDPKLAARLMLEDFVGFVVLAAEVVPRFEAGFGASATVTGILPFTARQAEK